MGPGREGHWHNHLAQAGALMGNGTVVKSGIHRVVSGGHCLCVTLSLCLPVSLSLKADFFFSILSQFVLLHSQNILVPACNINLNKKIVAFKLPINLKSNV